MLFKHVHHILFMIVVIINKNILKKFCNNMSGGTFEYTEHWIKDIVERIEQEIRDNNVNPYWSNETIEKLKEGTELLKKAYVYARRIDYLIGEDDSENSFHKRLEDDLNDMSQYFSDEYNTFSEN